jgi:hypothetical protein
MSFVEVPILRGFTEVEPLFNLSSNIAYICGGYARYCCSQNKKVTPAQDCDVFPTTETSYETLKAALVEKIGFEVSYENGVCLTLRVPKKVPDSMSLRWKHCPQIQLIKPVVEGRVVTVGSIEDILGNFDFTITRAAIIRPDACLVDENFIKDESNHLLRLETIHCPISSLLRCIKYGRKGYWMRPSEALNLFLDWDNRGQKYKDEIIELFKTSMMKDDQGKQIKMEQQEIDRLETMLRRD